MLCCAGSSAAQRLVKSDFTKAMRKMISLEAQQCSKDLKIMKRGQCIWKWYFLKCYLFLLIWLKDVALQHCTHAPASFHFPAGMRLGQKEARITGKSTQHWEGIYFHYPFSIKWRNLCLDGGVLYLKSNVSTIPIRVESVINWNDAFSF